MDFLSSAYFLARVKFYVTVSNSKWPILIGFFYFRFPDINSLSRAQALEIRDECLSNIRVSLEDKERYLSEQIQSIKEEMRLKVFIFIRYDFIYYCQIFTNPISWPKR